MPKILAIIPARGGSKAIPRKNVRLLAGKPLVAHTIEQVRQSSMIDRVVVSTDDPEIAMVAQRFGAEVVWRPVEISGDLASSESALLHVLDHLAQTEQYHPDVVVFLQCTSPLTLTVDVEGTIQALLTQNADTALAVVPFHYFLWRVDEKGDFVGINHDKRVRLMRQQREPQYRETGAVYVMRTQGFLEHKHRFFGKTAHYEIPQERCLEIDEPVDFEIAEMLMAADNRHHVGRYLPTPIQAIVFDFDGVFTDNRVMVFQDGTEAVLSHRGDGWGIARLRELGIPLLVLSTEENPVVQARCTKLRLPCIQGCSDKLAALTAWAQEQGVKLAHTVFVGNDVNDLTCLEAVGCGVIVANAHPGVHAAAKIVLKSNGGMGAIRELCDLILATRTIS